MAEAVAKTDEDVTIDYIRDELRDEISLTRKQHRDASVNKIRTALSVTNNLNEQKETSEEFVTTLATNLKKKPLSNTDYNKLQNALIRSDNHINAFFQVNNALHGLIRDLSGTSSQRKLAAANCCCNLALGNSKACFTLCKFAAPYLIAELESTSQPLVEACAWTIGNSVSECNKAFPILHAQGCMKSLINLAHQCSDDLLPAVSYACVRYVHKGFNVINRSEIVNLTLVVAQRYPAVSDTDTMWLLASLSSIPECTDHLIPCTLKICQYLLEAVFDIENNSIEKISAALRVVCNIVSETSGKVASYLLKEGWEYYSNFFEILLFHPYTHIRHETLWLLGNLSNHCLDSIRQLINPIIASLPTLKILAYSINKMI